VPATTTHRLARGARTLARAARTPVASARTLGERLARFPDLDRRYRQLEGEIEHLRSVYETWVPPGHYYSPFPDLDDYERRAASLHDPGRELVGIDLHEDDQLALLRELAEIVTDAPFPEHETDGSGGPRYWFDNPAYSYGDGIVLHGMLRRLRPRRVVEVGSGYSSAMLLDTVDGWLPGTQVTFVEPYPALLERLLRPGDEERVTIHSTAVQDMALDTFEALAAGDLLFVDSTHVVKAGSDVNFLVFEVLPRLRAGVWVHVHDIFFPFEYPQGWVREGRAWHEAYLLRAFLAYNPAFAIRWFQDFLWAHHRAELARLPWVAHNPGANLWIERVH
jgi:predicted O-methyltransferase YrrM